MTMYGIDVTQPNGDTGPMWNNDGTVYLVEDQQDALDIIADKSAKCPNVEYTLRVEM